MATPWFSARYWPMGSESAQPLASSESATLMKA